jgi:hypothetical protein
MKRWWHRLFEGWVAEVRREARQRALDELEALATGTRIEAGVGVDVEAAYWKLRALLSRREA